MAGLRSAVHENAPKATAWPDRHSGQPRKSPGLLPPKFSRCGGSSTRSGRGARESVIASTGCGLLNASGSFPFWIKGLPYAFDHAKPPDRPCIS